MHTVTKEEILRNAQTLNKDKIEWHFHLLTLDCLLNTSEKFVLVVENKQTGEVYGYLSEDKPMDTSEQLLRLLHGNKIMDEKEELGEISEKVKEMMQRATELNEKGFFWHHHVLFPYCTYNQHPGLWTIVLEDPEKKEMMESVSDSEPKADMKEIEPAFYHQTVH